MVEQGLVLFIHAGIAGSPPSTPPPGGFPDVLEKDLISATTRQAWLYKEIDRIPDYTLQGRTGWTEWNVQIDCHGYTAKDAIALRYAIWKVMKNGFQGTFSDPDSTYVFGIYERPWPPGAYSEANHSYVRPLEYQVIYQQT